jgi:AsmA protein
MRGLKIAGIAIGTLLALIVALLIAVAVFINPNDYKGRIISAVRQSTGRQLELPGDIKLSVFPWIALQIGPASLGNPPGFGPEPFAQVQHAALRVRLLPLLRKQLRIGRIEIDGLDLRLRKNAAGEGNWQLTTSSSSAPQSGSSSSETLADVGGIIVKDSRFSYQDTVADHISVEVGHLGSGASVPVSLKLSLIMGRDAKPIVVAFSAPNLSLDLQAQTLSAPSFNAQLADARLGGSLQGTKILDAPAFTGSFKLEPVALRALMAQLGMTAPVTRDPQALSQFAASGDFAYGANAAQASKLDVRLDDSTLRGNVAITNLDSKATKFDLELDRINLDRYRAPEQPAATAKVSEPPAPKAGETASDPLKTLQMDGTLSLGSAVVAGLSISQAHAHLTAAKGITHIAPAGAKLYGGEYAGEITLDDAGSIPSMKLDQSMTNVDIAQLLKDLAHTQRVSGRGNVTTHLTAQGRGSDDILKTLNGHAAVDLASGAVEGIDLWFEINRAVALIQKQSFQAGGGSGRTKFDAFKATADITNGVAATKDLSIISQNLHIAGQGSTNLVNDQINYQLKTTILKGATPNVAHADTLADIPLTISGTISSPEVRPDMQALARTAVQQQLDKHKDELRQKVQDTLKGLLK